MKYARILNLPNLLEKKSFFLLGPRATGKSSLIIEQLGNAKIFDLIHAPTFSDLSRRPTLIEEYAKGSDKLIVIDEVQKLPNILDEVHRIIEKYDRKFLLTGSSARKLKHGNANLLAGRAWSTNLFPLCHQEITDFDLLKYLTIGGLPSVYTSKNPFEELRAYTGTYLKEEIQAEAIVRKFESFITFLDIASTKVGEEIVYESIANDCGVTPRTIQNFFELLNDTLVGYTLRPFKKTKLRKSISRSKFYFFDIGVTHSLQRKTSLQENSDDYGKAFEQFIILELRAYLSYQRSYDELTFWRSQSGFEVDAIIGNKLAIEIKSTNLVQNKHLKNIKKLREEGLIKNYCIISRDSEKRIIDGITVYPWKEFLDALWGNKLELV